ncbi:MAG: PDZ domain-containing protein [Firmicutes bacterium]|uniref:endopeptidase La n=1 Tax=Melghirimyces thermohalophilus TaxID=1236220 RepID=A0A1G6NHY6_9BACL|nr:SepM family pheromone-processing serine protease [Melghirimyces thermohalophilus]MDA8352676.1 PDZ domain-containing protein [Bacillota bacterium]SDC67473.1 PDZ domain-containing protein [Melghirimyces thermohalophilus]
MKYARARQARFWIVLALILGLLLYILFIVPVPYYIVKPGSAMKVASMIRVDGPEPKEKGTFLMTTVSMGKGNLFGMMASKVNPRYELLPKEKVLPDKEDPEIYQRRQEKVMQLSQDDAVIAAFRELGRPVQVNYAGVRVFRVLKGFPAADVLQQGDLIKKVDGKTVTRSEDLIAYLNGKDVGEGVRLQIQRKGKLQQKTLKLGNLATAKGKKQPGVGIEPITERTVKTDPHVRIEADDIGGPSAGLMFALEIIKQLKKTDLAHGYRIAGTGTITPTGKVGQIGGVEHKVMAADREDADFFFVPADTRPGDSNEQKAKQRAKEIGTDMKVVPVKTLTDALTFLEKLPLKKNADHRGSALTVSHPLAYN